MIYTIGHRESYEQYFSEEENPQKLGREIGYVGGSVWRTKEDAEKFCPPDYSVYGVNADWCSQTTQSLDGDWHDLLITSNLIKLD